MKPEKLIWVAIVFSTFVYAVIAFMLNPAPAGAFEDAVRSPTTLVLYGLALAAFVAGLVLPGLLRDGIPRVRMVVSLAIFESCAVFGLMAALIARDWRVFIPAWIVGLLGMWRVYPASGDGAVTV